MKYLISLSFVFLSVGTTPLFSQACAPPVGSSLQVFGVANNDVLNVREGVGTRYTIIDTLPPDTVSATFVGGVQFTNQNCEDLCQNSNYGSDNYFVFEASCVARGRVWYEIVTENRILGWASAKYFDVLASQDTLQAAGGGFNDARSNSPEHDNEDKPLTPEQLARLRDIVTRKCIETPAPGTLFRNMGIFSDQQRKGEYCECFSNSVIIDGFSLNDFENSKGLTTDQEVFAFLTNGGDLDEIMSRCEGSEVTISTNRINYIKEVLITYNTAMMCAELGMVGGFTPSYIQRNFEQSSRNDLSTDEMNILSEYDMSIIRSMGPNPETCGMIQLGLTLYPNFVDSFFDQ